MRREWEQLFNGHKVLLCKIGRWGRVVVMVTLHATELYILKRLRW